MQKTHHNPFSLEHLVDQATFYGVPGETLTDGLEIALLPITSGMSHYLSPSLLAEPIEITIPRILIDGLGWMDLGLSEVQSAALPIAVAKGRVMTAGLGLGYYALAAAAKDEVDHVVVYEIDLRVIEWFVETFKDRKEFEKLEIRRGDVRLATLHTIYDTVFMDPYLGMLRDDVLSDIDTFRRWVRNIDDYRFWGLEVVLQDAVEAGENPRLLDAERDFFHSWKSATVKDGEPTGPHQSRTTKPYRDKVLEKMGRR